MIRENWKNNNQKMVEESQVLFNKIISEYYADMKNIGLDISDIEDQYPGFTGILKKYQGYFDDMFEISKTWAIAQDQKESKAMIAQQMLLGMVEKQRRQLILMDSKLDALIRIEKVNEE